MAITPGAATITQTDSRGANTRVYKFDPRSLPNEGIFIFLGRTGSGKTILMEDILGYKANYFKRAIVMTGSAAAAVRFGQHIPPIFVHDGDDAFDEKLLVQIVDTQDLAVKKCQCPRCRDEPGYDKKWLRRCLCKPIVIVLDDLGYLAKSIQKCTVIKRIFQNGRHFRIMLLLSVQYCKSFPPELRQQVSFVFACFEKNPENRRRVFEAFNTVFDRVKDFDIVMRQCTQNREVMVMSNVFSQSFSISDNVFWYKAPYPPLPWRLNEGGSAWRFHEMRYDPQYYVRQQRDRDASKLSQAKPGTLVVTKAASHRRMRK